MEIEKYSLRLLLAIGILSGRFLFATYEEPYGLIAGRINGTNTLYAAILEQDQSLTPLTGLPTFQMVDTSPFVNINNNIGFIATHFWDSQASASAPTAFLVHPTATYSVITLSPTIVNNGNTWLNSDYNNGYGVVLGDNNNVSLINNGTATTVQYSSLNIFGSAVAVNSTGLAVVAARNLGNNASRLFKINIENQDIVEVDVSSIVGAGLISEIWLNDAGVTLLGWSSGNGLYQIDATNSINLVQIPQGVSPGQGSLRVKGVGLGGGFADFIGLGDQYFFEVKNLVMTLIGASPGHTFGRGAISPDGLNMLMYNTGNLELYDLSSSPATVATLATTFPPGASVIAVDNDKNLIFAKGDTLPNVKFYVKNATGLTETLFPLNIDVGGGYAVVGALGFTPAPPPPPPPPPPGPTPGPEPTPPGTPTNIESFGSNAEVPGNTQVLAGYFLDYAPETLSFLAASIEDGTIAEAMASISPGRNTQSSASASFNNSRSAGSVVSARVKSQQANSNAKVNAQLLSSLTMPGNKKVDFDQLANKQSFWMQGVGCFAHQGAQNQTPSYNSSTGGVILGYDRFINDYLQLGVGASYMYTSLKQGQNAGHSSVNQENIILYSALTNGYYYLDTSLTGGFFQIHQVRNVQMTGFSAQAVSNPSGYNLVPHAEIGFNLERNKPKWVNGITFNPFVMLDWASTWQNGFSESGAAPFNMGQTAQYSSILRTELGMRLTETVAFKHFDLILQEKGSYVNMQLFGVGTNTGFIVGSPGFFTLDALYSQLGLGAVQLVVVLEPHNTRYPSIDAVYQGEFSYIYMSNQCSLGLTWRF